jgi:hypothetical protein
MQLPAEGVKPLFQIFAIKSQLTRHGEKGVEIARGGLQRFARIAKTASVGHADTAIPASRVTRVRHRA